MDENYNITNSNTTTLSRLHQIETVVLPMCAFFIIIINSLVVVAFLSDKKLRSRPANVLICSQASIDFFIGAIFVTVYLVELQLSVKIALPYIIFYILFTSLFNLLALSIDRYLALSRPFFHHRAIDNRRTVIVLAWVWITPFLVTLVPLSWQYETEDVVRKALWWYRGVMWVLMLVLVGIMTMLYFFVTMSARRTIKAKRKSIGHGTQDTQAVLAQKEVRVIHLFGLLLFFFVAAYFPIIYMNLCDLIGSDSHIPAIMESISIYSLVLNSMVNPVLCIYLKQDYFRVIVQLLRFRRLQRARSTSRSSNTKEFSEYFDDYDHSTHFFRRKRSSEASTDFSSTKSKKKNSSLL